MEALFESLSATTRYYRTQWLRKVGVVAPDSYDALRDVDKVMRLVKASHNPNTQAVRLFHIIGFLRAVNDEPLADEYARIVEPIKQASVRSQQDTKTSLRSARYAIKLPELFKLFMAKDPTPTRPTEPTLAVLKAMQDHLILALYITMPALRNDWHSLSIIRKKADIPRSGNYIMISSRSISLTLREYKTARHYGERRIVLSQYAARKVRDLLAAYKALGITPPSLINHISQAGVTAMTEDALKARIPWISSAYFGRRMSINDYRHLHEIALQSSPEYQKMSIAEREDAHRKLLHGMHTALAYNRILE